MSQRDYLANFLGPKAEQSEFVSRLVNLVLDDYTHWRRNYYPADKSASTPFEVRELSSVQSGIEEAVMVMLSKLRRSFPFYSPRYVAHQQGETAITALIGSIAGILYNANNITTESGPETLEMEIDACSRLLEMLGLTAPPTLPSELTKSSQQAYNNALAREYGWCHITSGGTVANIEALWVARAVKYMPLTIHNVCITHDLDIPLKFPNESLESERADHPETLNDKGRAKNSILRIAQDRPGRIQLLSIRPNESMHLLRRYLEGVRKSQPDLSESDSADLAWRWLKDENEYGLLRKGFARCMSEFPPVIFVTGAAHYSIKKAANILGIGEDHIRLVEMDSRFRMRTEALRTELNKSYASGSETVLAVIGIVGTTEEGAVDPIHEIVDIRKWSEEEHGRSFWIHVDAAWGGYFRTLLKLSDEDEVEVIVPKIFEALELVRSDVHDPTWVDTLFDRLIRLNRTHRGDPAANDGGPARGLPDDFDRLRRDCRIGVSSNDYGEVLRIIRRLERHIRRMAGKGLTEVSLPEYIHLTSEYVYEEVEISLSEYDYEDRRERIYSTLLSLRFNDPQVISSLHAMQSADSVTVDPHKMGYLNYACGVVAFRNDWARAMIQQRAPYITLTSSSRVVHPPMRRVVECDLLDDTRGYKIVIDSFGPYTLEGSRPSYPAAALWLTTEVSPLDRLGHGAIVKAAWLAAREIYEWLVHLDDALRTVRPRKTSEFRVVESGQPRATGSIHESHNLEASREDSKPEVADPGIDLIEPRARNEGDAQRGLGGKVSGRFEAQFEIVFFANDGRVPVPPDTNLVLFAVKQRNNPSIEEFNILNKRIHGKFAILAELGDQEFSYGHPYFLSSTRMEEPYYAFQCVEQFLAHNGFSNIHAAYEKYGLTALRATVMSPYQVPLREEKRQEVARDFALTLARTVVEVGQRMA